MLINKTDKKKLATQKEYYTRNDVQGIFRGALEAFTSQDNVKRQYLFNSASELWILDGANKQILTRVN